MTRHSAKRIWLIGPTSTVLTFQPAVTCHSVLSVFFHHLTLCKGRGVYFCAEKVANELLDFAKRKNITTPHVRIIIRKITKLYEKWLKLKNHLNRRTPCELKKRSNFLVDILSEFPLRKCSYFAPAPSAPQIPVSSSHGPILGKRVSLHERFK